MKKVYFPTVAAISLLLAACGSSKNAVSDYQYQQWKQQNQAQSELQRPSRTLRTEEPCIELAQSEGEYWREYGTATSYVEKVALNEAARDARNRLASRMKTAVEGAAQDYERNANQNLKKSAETLGEAVMTQFVSEEIKNTRIIKTSIYDLSDGSVQVYVCMEMGTNKGNFEKKLDNTLDRNGILEIEFDRERFVKKMSEGLEEYKKRHTQE